jgi:GNAT superfamily N-acetyltransferase
MPPTEPSRDPGGEVSIGPLSPDGVDAADRVTRVAFGTFLGAAEPVAVFGDMEHVRSRFAADPNRAFAAHLAGEVVGSIFATRWGSYGSFGPLTVRPELWDRGIAGRLLVPVMDLFESWGVRLAGLFTFAQSPKHVGLYQSFGFWPQHLTAIMTKPLAASPGGLEDDSGAGSDAREHATYSQTRQAERAAVLGECHEVTDAIFPGLDAGGEISATDALGLGDTVLLREGPGLAGFAVCHCGAGEAGSGACFIKFGAVRPGPRAGEQFDRLLRACEALGGARGAQRLMAGVSFAREDAYRRLRARGYRAQTQGVVMQRPNEPGYCRPDVYAIDDLR